MLHHSCSLLLLGSAILLPLSAKDQKPKSEPNDEIRVIAHIAVTGGPVKRFLTTQHYSSFYVYAEHEKGGNATLIDLTNPAKPKVLAEFAYASTGDQGLRTVAGTAAMVASGTGAPANAVPRDIKIMDFSDPANPKVAREFTGVTAMTRDDRQGLTLIANPDGIWILQQHLAEDPEVEKAYANYVIYGWSMRPPQ